MSISNVSFSGIVVVSGKDAKMNKVSKKFQDQSRIGSVEVRDVTAYYRNSSSNGSIARAAESGDKVKLFITGDDVARVRTKQKGWDSLDNILSNMTSYLRLDDFSISEAVQRIIKG